MEEIDYVKIGKRIKEGRLHKKLTQEKLSELIDVSPSYISEIERGTSIASLSTVVKLSYVLDLNLDNLVRGISLQNSDSTFVEILNNIPKKNHDLFISLCKDISNSLK